MVGRYRFSGAFPLVRGAICAVKAEPFLRSKCLELSLRSSGRVRPQFPARSPDPQVSCLAHVHEAVGPAGDRNSRQTKDLGGRISVLRDIHILLTQS